MRTFQRGELLRECMQNNIWENWVDLPRGNFQQDQSEWEHHTLHSLSSLKPGQKTLLPPSELSFPLGLSTPDPASYLWLSSSPSSAERRKTRSSLLESAGSFLSLSSFPAWSFYSITSQPSRQRWLSTERKALLRCALPIYQGMQSLHYLPGTNAERCQLPCQQLCSQARGTCSQSTPPPTPAAACSPGPETCISNCKVDVMPTKSWQTRKDQETVSGQRKLRKHEKWTQWGVLA